MVRRGRERGTGFIGSLQGCRWRSCGRQEMDVSPENYSLSTAERFE